MNEEKSALTNILYLVDGLFYKDIIKQIRGNDRMFYLYNHDIYRELLKIKNRKYVKLANKELISYIYHNDFLKFNVNTKDPLYFTKFIRLYIDKEEYGNTIYHNMTKFLYFSFIKDLKESKSELLNKLINEYRYIIKEIYRMHKYDIQEIQKLSRLLVYLLTYLYMNNELLTDNDNLFYETYKRLTDDFYLEDMKLNGVFEFIGQKEEDEIKIYFIEKAINEVISKNSKVKR